MITPKDNSTESHGPDPIAADSHADAARKMQLPVFGWVEDDVEEQKARQRETTRSSRQEKEGISLFAPEGDTPKDPTGGSGPADKKNATALPDPPALLLSSSLSSPSASKEPADSDPDASQKASIDGSPTSVSAHPYLRIFHSSAAEQQDRLNDALFCEHRRRLHEELLKHVRIRTTTALDARTKAKREELGRTSATERHRRQQSLAEKNRALREKLSRAQAADKKRLEPSTEKQRAELEGRRLVRREQKQKQLARRNKFLKQHLRGVGSSVRGPPPKPKQKQKPKAESCEQGKPQRRREVPESKPLPKQPKAKQPLQLQPEEPSRVNSQSRFKKVRFDEKQRTQEAAERRNKSTKEELVQVRSGKAVASAGNGLERKQNVLESKRRSQEEQRRREIAEQNKIFRERLKAAKSPIQSYKRSDSLQLEEQRRVKQEQRRTETERRIRELAEKNASLRRMLAEAKGRERKALDSSVEHARLEKERFRRSEARERNEKLTERNARYRERLAGAKCQLQKSLNDTIEYVRVEKELFLNREAVRREKDLAKRNMDLRKRLAGVKGRDAKSLDQTVEARRAEQERMRRERTESRKAELEMHRARLQKLVRGAKSPIRMALRTRAT